MRRKRDWLRFFSYKANRLIKKARAIIRSLRPPVRYTILGVGAALVVALVLLIVRPEDKAEAQQSFLPEARAQSFDDTDFIAFEDSEPEYVYVEEETIDEPPPDDDITLYQGCEDSERVAELQQRLMNLGYLDLDEPTQHFGPATKYAVQLFQRQHDIEQDGWAGPVTLELIYADEAKKYTLMEGMKGTDVDNFQRQLKDLGYLSKVTGNFGSETTEAVKAFQKENGLSTDGKAGEKTFNMINSDQAKQSPTLAKQARQKANISKMIETAQKQIGKKYILGNVGPNSYDCSGLVYYCLKAAGSNRRRLNAAGYSAVSDWEKITGYSKLQKGDLLFFTNNAKTSVGHVGIYIGGGRMIDASSGKGKVVKRSISDKYWKEHFVHARRPW